MVRPYVIAFWGQTWAQSMHAVQAWKLILDVSSWFEIAQAGQTEAQVLQLRHRLRSILIDLPSSSFVPKACARPIKAPAGQSKLHQPRPPVVVAAHVRSPVAKSPCVSPASARWIRTAAPTLGMRSALSSPSSNAPRTATVLEVRNRRHPSSKRSDSARRRRYRNRYRNRRP